jgi:hypothetical protein
MGFLDAYSGIWGSIGTTFKYVLYLLPVPIVIIIVAAWIRHRIIFKYKVRVFRVRENGKVLESNYVGGYIGRKNLAPFFRVKTGRWWWQYIDFIETPKIEYMDEEDRLYYKQIDVGTFVQLKRNIVGDKLLFTPVESDVKYGAVLSVQRIKDVLRLEPTWKKILPYAGVIILAIVFIVAYAMLMNKCSGGG